MSRAMVTSSPAPGTLPFGQAEGSDQRTVERACCTAWFRDASEEVDYDSICSDRLESPVNGFDFQGFLLPDSLHPGQQEVPSACSCAAKHVTPVPEPDRFIAAVEVVQHHVPYSFAPGDRHGRRKVEQRTTKWI